MLAERIIQTAQRDSLAARDLGALARRSERVEIGKELLRRLRVRTGLWPGPRARKNSLLVELQPGQGQAIFWCVQGADDVLALKQTMATLENPAYVLSSLCQLAPNGEFDETDASLSKALASHYVKEIRAIQPDGPYFLAGHCSGTEVAYEIAQQLTSEGSIVNGLLLVEPAQSFQVPTPLHAFAAWSYMQAARVRQACVRQLDNSNALVSEFLHVVGRTLESVKGPRSARAANLQLIRIQDKKYDPVLLGPFSVVRRPGRHRFLPGVLDAYAAAHGHPYLFLPYPGRVTLIYGDSSQYNYRNVGILQNIVDSFWSERALGGVEMYTIRGGHYPWHTESGRRAIATIISNSLQQV